MVARTGRFFRPANFARLASSNLARYARFLSQFPKIRVFVWHAAIPEKGLVSYLRWRTSSVPSAQSRPRVRDSLGGVFRAGQTAVSSEQCGVCHLNLASRLVTVGPALRAYRANPLSCTLGRCFGPPILSRTRRPPPARRRIYKMLCVLYPCTPTHGGCQAKKVKHSANLRHGL